MLSVVDHSLIDVDDGLSFIEGLDEEPGGELPLQLTSHLIVDGHDGLDEPIAATEHLPHVLAQVRPADLQMEPLPELLLHRPQSQGCKRSIKLVLYTSPRPIMKLVKPRDPLSSDGQLLMTLCLITLDRAEDSHVQVQPRAYLMDGHLALIQEVPSFCNLLFVHPLLHPPVDAHIDIIIGQRPPAPRVPMDLLVPVGPEMVMNDPAGDRAEVKGSCGGDRLLLLLIIVLKPHIDSPGHVSKVLDNVVADKSEQIILPLVSVPLLLRVNDEALPLLGPTGCDRPCLSFSDHLGCRLMDIDVGETGDHRGDHIGREVSLLLSVGRSPLLFTVLACNIPWCIEVLGRRGLRLGY